MNVCLLVRNSTEHFPRLLQRLLGQKNTDNLNCHQLNLTFQRVLEVYLLTNRHISNQIFTKTI